LAWWRGNDRFRGGLSKGVTTRPKAWNRNLETLAELMDEDDESDVAMKAELMRELGEFRAAINILSCVDSPEYRDFVSQIRSLCDRADADVREL
jgi:hypothetical protein